MDTRFHAALVSLAAAVACLGVPGAASAQHPGDIPQPWTYEGSMELQRREQEAQRELEAQQAEARAAEEANYSRALEAQQATAPAAGEASYSVPSGGGGTPAVDWWSKPPLPAAKNRLLGRWQQVAARGASANELSAPFGGLLPPGTAEFLNGAFSGGCEEMFGRGVIAFNPSSLDWVAPDGHEEILNHVEYRGDGANVVVLSRDPGAVPALSFGFPNKDTTMVAGFNCTMSRVGSSTAANAALPAAPAVSSGPLGPPPAGPSNATLSVLTGEATPGVGMLKPFESTVIFVTTEDPTKALTRAGFGGPNPFDAWMAACGQSRERCDDGMKAMVASAVSTLRMGASGTGQTASLPSGQYFILGVAAYQGRSLIWHRPYFMRPGSNLLLLDQTNGTLG